VKQTTATTGAGATTTTKPGVVVTTTTSVATTSKSEVIGKPSFLGIDLNKQESETAMYVQFALMLFFFATTCIAGKSSSLICLDWRV